VYGGEESFERIIRRRFGIGMYRAKFLAERGTNGECAVRGRCVNSAASRPIRLVHRSPQSRAAKFEAITRDSDRYHARVGMALPQQTYLCSWHGFHGPRMWQK
jgi:hypothetical protein